MELPVKTFASQEAWQAWLHDHYSDQAGLWLKMAKKASGILTVTYAQALDVALCYGWIDGQKKTFDESYFLQRFTPRRARSMWSQVNRDKVEDLIRRGLMQPSGLAEIERAKADGRWDAAYASPRNTVAPDDLLAALAASPNAQAFFESLNKTNRYGIVSQVQGAKRPETRAARIVKFVAMCERGEKLYP
jgi:uncharacterized protein YdeI (YjbR/CyaY-like superfamily)